MRILLLLPYDSTYRYKGAFRRSLSYAPLTLTTLAALVPEELGAEIEILDEGVQPPYQDNGKHYDIVGITLVTSAALRAYELAAHFRSRGTLVVLGGPHPTLMPEEALTHADAVVTGGAEETWPRLLRDYLNGTMRRLYQASPGGSTPIPVPRRDLLPKGTYLRVPTVIANRGCNNGCVFCSVYRLWGSGDFTRPVGEVIAEIKRLGTKELLLLDPSPYSNRDYAIELFRALEGLKIRWAGLSTVDTAFDDEVLELMTRSGCKGLLVGFESLNQLSLNAFNKGFNLAADYKEAVARFHRGKIRILGCFILGFDQDQPKDYENIPDIIADLGVDIPRFSVLTPFPGTPLFASLKQEGRILTEDWGLYDNEHVVFQPQNMSPAALQDAFHRAWRESYRLEKVFLRAARMRESWFVGLIVNLGFRHLAGRYRTSMKGEV